MVELFFNHVISDAASVYILASDLRLYMHASKIVDGPVSTIMLQVY